VLIPPSDFELAPERLMGLAARAGLDTSRIGEVVTAASTIDQIDVTYVLRFRKLSAPDFALESPMLDRHGRAVIATEGVIFKGWFEVETDAVMITARDQFYAAIRALWLNDDDRPPATSRTVASPGAVRAAPVSESSVPQRPAPQIPSPRVLPRVEVGRAVGRRDDGSGRARFPGWSPRMVAAALVCALAMTLAMAIAIMVLLP
jgi:hypothetical protein